MNQLKDDEIDALIEGNEEIQKWRAQPKSQRQRLTRKQLVRMFKETSLAESIKVQVVDEATQSKKQRKLTKRAFVAESEYADKNDGGDDEVGDFKKLGELQKREAFKENR